MGKQEPDVSTVLENKHSPPSLSPRENFDQRVNCLIDIFCNIHYWQTGRNFAFLGRQSKQYYQFCQGELIRANLGWTPEGFVGHINHLVNGGHRHLGSLRPQDLCSKLAIEVLRNNLSPTVASANDVTDDIDPIEMANFDFVGGCNQEQTP